MGKGKKKKIVAAGHICLDITPQFPDKKADGISDILRPGSLLETGMCDVHIGGSIANTGLGLKILGADVALMGKIGADAFGMIVKEQIAEYVSTNYMIESENENTSYSVVIAPKGIDRMFLHCPGANDTFSSVDPDYELIREADLFHFGYPPLMKNMFREEGEELVQMFRRVYEMGVATSLDTASVDENAQSGQVDWKKILKRVLPYVDFFVPSIEELAFMINRPLYQEWIGRAEGKDLTLGIREEEIRGLAETLLSWGSKVVMIKCGVPGLYLATGNLKTMGALSEKLGLDLFGWEDVRHFEKSYRPEKVLSATGAGDTTIAAFLYAVLQGYDWEECVQLAAAEGATCVETYDAISGLKSLEDLHNRIRAGWEKQEV